MLLTKLTNRLQGEVTLRVVSGFPERVLNLCGARQLSFWNVCWVSPTEFTCTMTRQDFFALRQAAKKLDCTLTVERRRGAPFLLGRLRRRQALLVGTALCGALLLLGSFFVWDFTVEGNATVTDEEILRSLQRNGVGLGTFGLSIDGEDLRNRVLLDIPELSWIAVNVSGCQAHVQVRERVEAPELADKRTPANIVARRDGLVLKVEALEGKKAVLPGTTVTEGQLLISGIEDTDTFGARMMAGLGTVTARTWYTLTVRLPLTVERKVYTGEEKTRLALIFGTHRVKFYGNSSIEDVKYDKILERTPLRLFGLSLPVTAEQETLRIYTTESVALEPTAAQKRGEAILTAYLHTLVDEGGEVRSTLCTARDSGDGLTVTLTAECVEQIGRQVAIYMEGSA